jgi:PAS domain S-box-containing protein
MMTAPGQTRVFFDRGRLHIETEERRMDGTPMWVEGRTAVIPASLQGRQCVVFVACDITDRKRAEEPENQVVSLRE